jgi:hypothetical protein
VCTGTEQRVRTLSDQIRVLNDQHTRQINANARELQALGIQIQTLESRLNELLGCRLGDDLFLVVDDVDRLLEQAIGAQLDGDVVLALELGAIGAPAVDRAFDFYPCGRLERSIDELEAEEGKELVELQPEVIVAHSSPVVATLLGQTRNIPIIFVSISDPIGEGFVASFARQT